MIQEPCVLAETGTSTGWTVVAAIAVVLVAVGVVFLVIRRRGRVGVLGTVAVAALMGGLGVAFNTPSASAADCDPGGNSAVAAPTATATTDPASEAAPTPADEPAPDPAVNPEPNPSPSPDPSSSPSPEPVAPVVFAPSLEFDDWTVDYDAEYQLRIITELPVDEFSTTSPDATIDWSTLDLDPSTEEIDREIMAGCVKFVFDPATHTLAMYLVPGVGGGWPSVPYTVRDTAGVLSNVATFTVANPGIG